ncbi:hypothetical protein B0H14DRAFT_2648379, partial [Mycena olivaceomarginata]
MSYRSFQRISSYELPGNLKELELCDFNFFQETHLRPQQHDVVRIPEGYSIEFQTRRPKANFAKSWGGVATVSIRVCLPKLAKTYLGPTSWQFKWVTLQSTMSIFCQTPATGVFAKRSILHDHTTSVYDVLGLLKKLPRHFPLISRTPYTIPVFQAFSCSDGSLAFMDYLPKYELSSLNSTATPIT